MIVYHATFLKTKATYNISLCKIYGIKYYAHKKKSLSPELYHYIYIIINLV